MQRGHPAVQAARLPARNLAGVPQSRSHARAMPRAPRADAHRRRHRLFDFVGYYRLETFVELSYREVERWLILPRMGLTRIRSI